MRPGFEPISVNIPKREILPLNNDIVFIKFIYEETHNIILEVMNFSLTSDTTTYTLKDTHNLTLRVRLKTLYQNALSVNGYPYYIMLEEKNVRNHFNMSSHIILECN